METIDNIIDKIKEFNIPGKAADIFGKIAAGAKTVGRATTRQLLCLYYTLKEGNLTGSQKAWIYAALAYVLIPGDLLPRRVFYILGLTDDAVALAYVVAKVKDHITPQILQKVDIQLDKWFGYEISMVEEQ